MITNHSKSYLSDLFIAKTKLELLRHYLLDSGMTLEEVNSYLKSLAKTFARMNNTEKNVNDFILKTEEYYLENMTL